jgi:hypothetical protein
MFAVLIGAFSYCGAQPPGKRMDQVVRSFSDSHQFMGSVLAALLRFLRPTPVKLLLRTYEKAF